MIDRWLEPNLRDAKHPEDAYYDKLLDDHLTKRWSPYRNDWANQCDEADDFCSQEMEKDDDTDFDEEF